MADWLIAKMINQALGGPMVAPWDVQYLDETTVEIARGLISDLPVRQRLRGAIEKRFAQWRARHPTYKKRR